MALPMDVVPSRNVTVPAGTVVFPTGPATVAVKVTDAPVSSVVVDAVSAVLRALNVKLT